MYTDSHCHLDPEVYGGDAGVDAVVERARAAGVTRMITIGSGYEPPCAERAAAVAERHPDVWFAVGIHPHDAKHWSPAAADMLAALAKRPRCVALRAQALETLLDLGNRGAA